MDNNEKNIMNTSLVVDQLVSVEEALETVKKEIRLHSPRASFGFKEAFEAISLSELTYTIRYAPVYHVQTEGSYEWTETNYHNVGNAVIGNHYVTTEHTKSTSKNSSFVVDKSLDNGVFVVAPGEYLKDTRKIFTKIDNEKAIQLPMQYPLTTFGEMVKEIAKNASQNHKGSYDLSNINVVLVLVPIIEFTFTYNDLDYNFYVNLYSGMDECFDVDTSPFIEQTFEKIKKIKKICDYIKFSAIGALVLSLIICIARFSSEVTIDLPSLIFLWVLSSGFCGLVIFLPRKKQVSVWDKIEERYCFEDDYIKDYGSLSFKGIVFVSGHILQCVLVAIPALFFLLSSLFGR